MNYLHLKRLIKEPKFQPLNFDRTKSSMTSKSNACTDFLVFISKKQKLKFELKNASIIIKNWPMRHLHTQEKHINS